MAEAIPMAHWIPGTTIYRCNLCGECFRGERHPDLFSVLAAPDLMLHDCKDGSIGVGDLVGGKREPKEAPHG